MIKLRSYLKKKFSVSSLLKLQKVAQNLLKVMPFGLNLNQLGVIYGTDKVLGHSYTQHYTTHLKRFRYKKINLLEIGVGGYDNPKAGGQSLRMWKRYFLFGKIFSLDIFDKSQLQEKRIKIFKGSQVDKDFLNKVTNEIGELDIIIDDGSHINEHVIESFKLLFPKLKDGGVYVVEDMQTSYWEDFGGDSKDLKNPKTMMNYFKSLTDSLNNQEFLIPNYQQNYFDKKIISMHFYHNMVFIYKGNNDEKSNILQKK
ncbi:class I SAM-dependent methyltransferase [Polaribacter pectinis]|uniref:Class I SAM-dependent methyltransferase n=1 Tax=Polaribacter pectinis TaxID=2738844 RepID=A0A7G9L6B4_9FLAO|nr:class I SAM-dependent methyltransferase [Polaribacter pectinis]QNM84163.1 class I SAM-dependent methyltransferase [Polaribacter pectinis]